jgi:hypothetical protein
LRYLQLQPSDELSRRQLDVLHRGPAQTSSWPREKLSTREIVDGIKTGGWKAASHKTETTFQPIEALLPAEKPQAQRPAKPLPGARVEPQVVVVNEVRGGVNVGGVIAASVVVVAVAAVVFLATRTKESLDEQERKRGAALVHHLDATPEMHVRAKDALARARAAVVARNGADAVDAADEALAFPQLDPDELLAAQFLKAEGYALSGDKASARLAVDDYLKRARLGHPDHAAAIALEGRLR